ncbi:MAG: hypothetical protein RQ715_07940 [Methylococcales bacterium]|nr:hypothetical protein [Methylococcales bacterium]
MWLTSIPLMTAYSGWFKLFDFILLHSLLAVGLYYLTPQTSGRWQGEKPDSVRLALHAAWLGRASLAPVFWPFFLMLNGVWLLIDYRARSSDFTIPSWDTAHWMLLLPLFAWLVAVWRCSPYCQHRIWSAAARWAGLAVVIDLLLRVYIRHVAPQWLFDCMQLSRILYEC